METAATILQAMDNLAIGLLNTKFVPVIGEKVEWTTLRVNSTWLGTPQLTLAIILII